MKSKIITQIQNYAIITFGIFLFSIGWTAFLLPSQITGGGVTGIGAVVYFITGFPMAATYFLVNVVLLGFAAKILGIKYALKSVFGMVMTSVFLGLLSAYIKEPVVKEPFMACVVGGILAGAGIGLVFNGGGSTGGTDIIASVVNKYKQTSPGKVILFCDVIIIGSTYFVFGSIEKIVYGLSAMVVASYSIDLVLSGLKQSVQFFIVSKEYETISARIITEIHRGVTVFDGTGMYTHQPVKVMMVVAKRNQTVEIFRLIKSIDPKAFMSVGSVMGVFGEGFDNIKS